MSAENRKALDWRRANPIGAVRTIGRYGSMLGLIVIFVLAAFANRVAEMTWVLFTGYRFGWGPTETGLSLAMVGVMFVVGQGGLVRVIVPRLGERRAILLGLAVSAITCVLYGVVPRRLDGLPGHGARDLRLDDRAAGRAGPDVARGAAERARAAAGRAREHAESHVDRGAAHLDRPLRLLRVERGARSIVPGAAFFAAALVFMVALVLAMRWFDAT